MPPKRITDFFTSGEKSCTDVGTAAEILQSETEQVETDTQDSSTVNIAETEPLPKKRKFEAKFQDSWMKTYSWLKYDKDKGMQCDLCSKSGKKNPFTIGCTNYRTSTLSRHLESQDHVQAVRSSVYQADFAHAESTAHKKFSSKEKALIVAMRTAYHIAKTNISIRNYTGLLQLQEENGLDIGDLKVGDNATYSSRATAEEFIETFAEILEKRISYKLKNSEFVSIMCDESTDISVQKKLEVYGKVVDEYLDTKTHFLGNIKLSEVSVTAEVLFNHLKTFLESRNIPLSKVIGFGSDGASIMTGRKSGVATRIKQHSPHCISVHCMAHRLNLCSSKAADEVSYLKETFQKVLTDLYYYFSKSTVRTEELKEIQTVLNSPIVKMKEVHEIRWMSFYTALSAVYHSWKALVKYFKQHAKDSSRTASLYKRLSDYTFVATLYLMMDVIPPLAALNMVFQKQDLDIAAIRPAIDGFFSACKIAKTGKSFYQKLLSTDHFKAVDSKGTVSGVTLSNDKSRTVRDAAREFEKCRTDFLSKLEEQIKRRFPEDNTSIATAFQVLGLRSLSFLSTEELIFYGIEDLNTLIKHFGTEQTCDVTTAVSKPVIDAESTRAEWGLIKPLILEQKYSRDHSQTLWKIISQNHGSQFPNLIKLAKVMLQLPLQTADCERGFSCQNNIHTSGRNRLDPIRVNQLMLIQIEGPPSASFEFDEAVKHWKLKKERRLFKQ